MRKILIVEDDNDIAMLERDYLEIAGFSTGLAADGDAAAAAALSGEYDLILLDVMLPGRDGYDICRQLRDKIDVPILMVTARNDSVDKIRGLGLGADDYIAKPFDPAELVARVKAHLNRYRRLTGGRGEEDGAITVGDVKILPQLAGIQGGPGAEDAQPGVCPAEVPGGEPQHRLFQGAAVRGHLGL